MKSKDIPHISPQVAMDDYFRDMFGQANEDPLKKLEAEERSALDTTANQALDENRKTSLLKQELKPSSASKMVTDFAAPETTRNGISPLIIPAAFPKLAPPEIKKETLIKTEPKLNVSKKIDKKTALAILLKQKSSLTKEQRVRLKAKLKQLELKKQQEQNKTQTKTKTKVIEPSLDVSPSVKLSEPVHVPEQKVALQSNIISKVVPVSDVQNQEALSPAVPKMDRPAWTDRRFECLLFSVAGLKLAVPLISLGAIYKIEKDFTPLVGRASWFMGLYHHLDRNVRVVDTAQWVMPERCNQQVRDGYKFIIRLGDSDWGMACDAVHQSIQLYPDQVKWRSERTKRVWLYGTVIDHMCALIDADALNGLLEQQAPRNISH